MEVGLTEGLLAIIATLIAGFGTTVVYIYRSVTTSLKDHEKRLTSLEKSEELKRHILDAMHKDIEHIKEKIDLYDTNIAKFYSEWIPAFRQEIIDLLKKN